ncbi:MAG: hypothetical protein ABJ246_06750 [Paracoccaceae bacterium]
MRIPKGKKTFQMLACVLCLPIAAGAEPFEIKDAEGFDREMVAHVVNVPSGWTSTGRIAWNKPCSGNDLYETLFVTRSPDGQSGARIMPGYQFFMDTAQISLGYPPDPSLNMIVAQSEASLQNMATQFRGSNCAIGVLKGTQDIIDRLILPNRPSGARVLKSQANQSELTFMKQTFGGASQGVRVSFDSQIVDLGYVHNSVQTTERLYLSWYSFMQDPFDMGGVIVSNSHTVIDSLRLVWSPSASAGQTIPQLEQMLGSIQTDPTWQRRINEVRQAIQKQNDDARKKREAERDKRHNDFIQGIQYSLQAREKQSGVITVPAEK